MKQILLRNNGHAWIANHQPPSEWPEIIDLFGTLHLPTAFTGQALAHVVRAEIQRLNPDADVQIVEQDHGLAPKGWTEIEGSR